MEKLTFDEVRSLNRPLVARASASYSWGIPEWDNLWKCVQHSVDNGRKKTFPLSTLILEFKPWPPASSDGYFLVLEGAPYIITIFLVHAVFLDLDRARNLQIPLPSLWREMLVKRGTHLLRDNKDLGLMTALDSGDDVAQRACHPLAAAYRYFNVKLQVAV